ncbi:hypothetical protein HDE69_003401 [Pedobacter cryoconitis]|uniref:O-antigen polysaccharide polymerase Wzy n=1 Tax=Pedobacter cryoconitis TaxID=188932 RepID=A0A7W9DKK8_9SPHI|nr:hypothetical protein [Pedobacter cryoconitis]MBB5622326.1 hypothetical protein [Pedobacter cryoconitis]
MHENKMIGQLEVIGKNKLFKIIWVCITLMMMLIGKFDADQNKYLLVAGIITNIFIIWEFRKVQPALIMAVFFLSYVMYLLPYYFNDYLISAHSKYYIKELYDKTLGIHVLFLLSLYFFLSGKFNEKQLLIKDLIKPRENTIIFGLLYLAMLGILLTVKGESVLTTDSYATYIENLEKQGGSLEYFYILFICAYYFTTSKKLRNLLLLLVAYYVYTTVTKGYRIQLVQVIFLTFVLFFDGKFRSKYVMLLSFFGFILSEIIGVMKNVGSVSFEEFMKLYDNASGIIITNQTDVFYTSVVFVGIIRDGIMSFPIRVWSAVGFFWNCLVPSSFVWTEARIPQFASKYTSLGGGGLLSVYFYVWFGYLGSIGIGALLAKLFNKIYSSDKKTVFKITGLMILCTFPRWFAYDPANFLIRLPLYLLILYSILILLHNSFRRIKTQK